jgi:hypothetical protein
MYGTMLAGGSGMQQLRTIFALVILALMTSCSEQAAGPSETDQHFADIVDVKVSAQPNQVTCLMYVQSYSGCQDARVTSAQQVDKNLEVALTTFQSTAANCDTLQSVKKLWHTFPNLDAGTKYSVRIRAERDTRTNKPVDTLITVSVP